MCLRRDGSQGFPPPDIALRNWFSSIPDPTIGLVLHGNYMVSYIPVLTLTQEALHSLSKTERGEHASLVRQRQEKLALAFRDRMTGGQSFQGSNIYRKTFYGEVIELAMEFTQGSVEVPGSNPKSPSRYTHKMGGGVKEAGQKLCRFVDPHGLLDSDTGSRWPLVILAFDEAHILTDTPQDTVWTLFSELRRTLRGVIDFPIFSLFLSTAGRFHLFSPEIRSDPSNRITNSYLVPLDPISEISFDDLAFPAREDTVTLDRVVQLDWISHLGRPLFGSHYDALGNNEAELMLFAKQKLLNGKSAIDMDGPGSLACLCVRFALEFNADALSRAVTCTQVERHMRLCVAATTGFERMVTIAGSEPLLAEAASELMRTSTENPVRHLANHSDLNCVDRGRRGELVAAFIIMQARDASLPKSAIGRRWVSVSDFMQALLPSSAYEILQNYLPTCWREGEDKPFGETFADYAMWFNHVIRIEDGKMINAENLWKFITRGAMIMCANNQYGVDIVLPACVTTGNLSHTTVTAILIQVKNAERFECSIDKTLFDAMNPFRVGLFSDGQLPRPVIRVVFALASGEAGVLFPTIRQRNHHYADPFTAFDVWCAGLSPDTFRCIGDDLVPYQVLLERSLQPHDAFDLRETNDPRLDDETRAARGHRRRMMAALTMYQIGHNSIHI
ncbi:hypothetical protein BJV78DRAFT_1260011 [Lactifluus subvellereus]|nr:hypothetical protein BJV78DRAFT_1260011 [Lactifluus subvellereus]